GAEVAHSFWQAALSGDFSPTSIRTDFDRKDSQSFRGKTELVSLDVNLDQLIQVARSEKTTLFNLLVTVLNVILHRYTGDEEIIVGTPTSGRVHPDLEDLIGFFINTIPLRTKIKGEQTFRPLLRAVHESSTEALEHQLYPVDRLVHSVSAGRDMSRSNLFDVVIALQNTEKASIEIGGMGIRQLELETETAKFDLTFNFEEKEDRLELSLNYAVDLFGSRTIRSLIGN